MESTWQSQVLLFSLSKNIEVHFKSSSVNNEEIDSSCRETD